MSGSAQFSPLDELAISVDEIWARVAPGYTLTDAEIAMLVREERAARARFIKKDSAAKVKREEKKAEKQDKEAEE